LKHQKVRGPKYPVQKNTVTFRLNLLTIKAHFQGHVFVTIWGTIYRRDGQIGMICIDELDDPKKTKINKELLEKKFLKEFISCIL